VLFQDLSEAARARVDAALAGVESGERVRFVARLSRHLSQIAGPLAAIYPGRTDAEIRSIVELLCVRAATGFSQRPPDLRALDTAREGDPAWFQRPDRIGYVAYVDRFAGTLPAVRSRFGLLEELGVTYLHLMSVLRPREGANDGGFAILDYGDVDPALGTWDDLATLAADLRARGISLCLDLVMNHTAAEHRWAQLAREGSSRHRDYYLVFPDRSEPDRYEATLPEVFPEMAPGNFTWDEGLQGWVWTTFNTYQWDLNYANPAVVHEMLGVMLDLANVGAEVLRLDAIAFTWKRLGTDCQNQPEAHLLAQVFRALMAVAAPGVVLKAEAIVPPRQLVPYLGAHERRREECHLAYHNQLMVMLWNSLAQQDARLARRRSATCPPRLPTRRSPRTSGVTTTSAGPWTTPTRSPSG
jgi:amylosucrase